MSFQPSIPKLAFVFVSLCIRTRICVSFQPPPASHEFVHSFYFLTPCWSVPNPGRPRRGGWQFARPPPDSVRVPTQRRHAKPQRTCELPCGPCQDGYVRNTTHEAVLRLMGLYIQDRTASMYCTAICTFFLCFFLSFLVLFFFQVLALVFGIWHLAFDIWHFFVLWFRLVICMHLSPQYAWSVSACLPACPFVCLGAASFVCVTCSIRCQFACGRRH